jgi:imidazole glycerol-phosphate synthase subunit HisH
VTRVAVVDHGAGNLVSIAQGLERAGATVTIASNPQDLDGADGVVLPGVGAARAVMAGIERAGFLEPLRSLAVPLLGICVGMQVLFDSSEEDDATCLGLIAGEVKRLTGAPRLPHIGWNPIHPVAGEPLFQGLGDEPEMYFVHSYAPLPADSAMVIATATHGPTFVAAVRRGRVAGTQFHPERSGTAGLTVLANFVAQVAERAAA